MIKWPIAVLLSVSFGNAVAAELQIIVDNIASNAGNIRLALYNDPKTFRKEGESLKRLSVPAQPGSVTFRFGALPAGNYAAIAYHDDDANGRLNRFLGMIPTEGYGLSNNPVVTGPPRLHRCRFRAGTG